MGFFTGEKNTSTAFTLNCTKILVRSGIILVFQQTQLWVQGLQSSLPIAFAVLQYEETA